MAIPSPYLEWAERLGLTQRPNQSDDDFMRWIDNLRGHIKLVREARSFGVEITQGMTSAEVSRALCDRQIEVLAERGFSPESSAEVRLGERVVTVTKIVTSSGKNPTVTVHYWIVRPWTNKNNQGRANHRSASVFLQQAQLITEA